MRTLTDLKAHRKAVTRTEAEQSSHQQKILMNPLIKLEHKTIASVRPPLTAYEKLRRASRVEQGMMPFSD